MECNKVWSLVMSVDLRVEAEGQIRTCVLFLCGALHLDQFEGGRLKIVGNDGLRGC